MGVILKILTVVVKVAKTAGPLVDLVARLLKKKKHEPKPVEEVKKK